EPVLNFRIGHPVLRKPLLRRVLGLDPAADLHSEILVAHRVPVTVLGHSHCSCRRDPPVQHRSPIRSRQPRTGGIRPLPASLRLKGVLLLRGALASGNRIRSLPPRRRTTRRSSRRGTSCAPLFVSSPGPSC